MPLFMDLHKASDYEKMPTVEDIKRNHIADLEVQDKYGVKFLQYWINEEAGLVFCLMEAPDKESCAAVHREAHGAMPCNVIELQGGDYRAFLDDETTVNQYDIVENTDGTLDSGYRLIMVVEIISIHQQEFLIDEVANRCKGHFLSRPGHRKTFVFFPDDNAIECARELIRFIREDAKKPAEIRIAIGAGTPVTSASELFGEAIDNSNRLCDVSQNGQVWISSLAHELLSDKSKLNDVFIKTPDPASEQFLLILSQALNSSVTFNVDSLSRQLAISRSGLYRKIKELTGMSASSLIQEARLRKAMRLLCNRYGNVTQVAMEAGFTNLSYFAKTFQNRFGIAPLKAMKIISG